MGEYILNSIKRVPRIRYLIYSILIVCLAFNSYYYVQFYYKQVSFANLILSQTNELNTICFSLLFAFLVVSGDFLIEKYNNQIVLFSLDIGKQKKIVCVIGSCFLISTILIGVFILLNLLLYFFLGQGNYDFATATSLNGINISTQFALIQSIMLLLLRFISTILVILIFNAITKKWWGSIIVVFLNLFDFLFYEYTNIQKPTMILPFEHTLISYDSTSLFSYNRPEFWISYFYWIIIISILWLFYCFYFKHTKMKGIPQK